MPVVTQESMPSFLNLFNHGLAQVASQARAFPLSPKWGQCSFLLSRPPFGSAVVASGLGLCKFLQYFRNLCRAKAAFNHGLAQVAIQD